MENKIQLERKILPEIILWKKILQKKYFCGNIFLGGNLFGEKKILAEKFFSSGRNLFLPENKFWRKIVVEKKNYLVKKIHTAPTGTKQKS